MKLSPLQLALHVLQFKYKICRADAEGEARKGVLAMAMDEGAPRRRCFGR